MPGFCKSATTDEIAQHGHVLTPGRYVGAEEVEDDGEPFEEKMTRLVNELNAQFAESAKLEKAIKANLVGLGSWGLRRKKTRFSRKRGQVGNSYTQIAGSDERIDRARIGVLRDSRHSAIVNGSTRYCKFDSDHTKYRLGNGGNVVANRADQRHGENFSGIRGCSVLVY